MRMWQCPEKTVRKTNNYRTDGRCKRIEETGETVTKRLQVVGWTDACLGSGCRSARSNPSGHIRPKTAL